MFTNSKVGAVVAVVVMPYNHLGVRVLFLRKFVYWSVSKWMSIITWRLSIQCWAAYLPLPHPSVKWENIRKWFEKIMKKKTPKKNILIKKTEFFSKNANVNDEFHFDLIKPMPSIFCLLCITKDSVHAEHTNPSFVWYMLIRLEKNFPNRCLSLFTYCLDNDSRAAIFCYHYSWLQWYYLC